MDGPVRSSYRLRVGVGLLLATAALAMPGAVVVGGVGAASRLIDSDGDGIDDTADNCRAAYNPDQRDWDNDGTGNRCDTSNPPSASEIIFYLRSQTGQAPAAAGCFHYQWSANANVTPSSGDFCFPGWLWWSYSNSDPADPLLVRQVLSQLS